MTSKLLVVGLLGAMLAVPIAVKLASAKAREPVLTETITLRQVRPTILASGVLVFHQEVHLSSELIGPVVELLVREGDKVRKGQPLLRLDQRSYTAELEQQQSSVRSAAIAIERSRLQLSVQRTNLDRTAQLVDRGFLSASRHDEVAGQVSLAQVELQASDEMLRQATAQVQVIRERLAKTTLRAPIEGTVTALNIKVGETAVPNATGIQGSALATIADDASMLVEVAVDEADITSVAVGQQARVFPSATPERALDGEIQSISLSAKVAAQGRSYVVKVRLPGRHPDLRTGMTARVEIAGGRGDARPAVPLRALLSDAVAANGQGASDRGADEGGRREGTGGAASYVFKVVDGVVHKARVQTGLADQQHQEALAGLADGDVVVVGPARALRDLRDGQGVAPSAEPEAARRALSARRAPEPRS